jgi:hypothetical protein
MAAIYLTHPIHGAKVATMGLEADLDVQNGWSRYNSEPAAEEVRPEPVARRARRSKDVSIEGE